VIDRTTWKAIAIGLVSGTLLVYVVRPVLDHLPSITLRLAGTLSQSYTDSIYQSAAQPYSTDRAFSPSAWALCPTQVPRCGSISEKWTLKWLKVKVRNYRVKERGWE